jgi:AAA family ATP:ADP antiporter
MAASDLALPPPREKTALDRALSIFSRVEAGEGVSAILLAANLFLLLGAYYILKIIRESLILSEAGAVAASYASAVMAVILIFLVPAYGRFASKVDRIRLIGWVTGFFILNLPIFGLLGAGGVKVGFAYYVWLGIFNVLSVAQFWAFANDLYTEEQGKRLFPMIGVGASAGAWFGATMVTRTLKPLTPYQLMGVSALVLTFCILLTIVVHRRESARASKKKAEEASQPLGKEGGFQLIMKMPYLRWIALLILLLNVVNTMGGFLLNSLVTQEAGKLAEVEQEPFIRSFFGDFYGWQNLLGLLIQMFVVSRVFKYLGVRGAIFVLPAIALIGYSALAFFPVLALVRVTKLAENATDYSLQNTIRHALYLPTSREAKYKAKAAVDTFFVRTGDALQAGLVYVGTTFLGFAVTGFAVLNVFFVGLWLVMAVAIYREHKKITSQA